MESDSPQINKNLLIVIGASAGGITEINTIINRLPETFQGSIVVAVHRNPSLEDNFLKTVFQKNTKLHVREPVQNEHLQCTTIYISEPADNITIDGNIVELEKVTESGRMKRIDDLFKSVADHDQSDVIAVILSGMLWDGVEGLKAIKNSGGKCLVQHPEDAEFSGMPENALAEVNADFVGTTEQIADVLVLMARNKECS